MNVNCSIIDSTNSVEWTVTENSTNIDVIIEDKVSQDFNLIFGDFSVTSLWSGEIRIFESKINPLIKLLNSIGHPWGTTKTLETLYSEPSLDMAKILLRVINYNNKLFSKIILLLRRINIFIFNLNFDILTFYSCSIKCMPTEHSLISSISKTSPPSHA